MYEVPWSMSLLCFGMSILANFHMCGIMLVFRAVLNMLVSNPRGYMPFSCLMFRLSGPLGLLFLPCCIASWT